MTGSAGEVAACTIFGALYTVLAVGAGMGAIVGVGGVTICPVVEFMEAIILKFSLINENVVTIRDVYGCSRECSVEGENVVKGRCLSPR